MPTSQLLGGRYQVLKCLGSGSHGKTYLTSDTYQPTEPKCVVRQMCLAGHSVRATKFTQQLLRKRAEMLRQMGTHAQLSAILAHFEEGHSFYWVETFISGEPLPQIFKDGKGLPEALVIRMMQDIAQGLVIVHRWGMVHRGVKLDSIIRSQSDGRFVLVGFGIFREIGESDRPPTHPTGTTADASHGSEFRFSHDLRALGLVALQALSGSVPAAVKLGEVEETLALQAKAACSPALAAILQRMVQPDAEHHYHSAAEVLEVLGRLTPPRSSAKRLPLKTKPAQFWLRSGRRRHQWVIALTAAACFTGLAAVGMPQRLMSQYWLYRADETLAQGNSQKAIALTTRALDSAGPRGAAYLQRGLIYHQMENWEAAQSDLTQAIALSSNLSPQRAQAPIIAEAFYYRGDARNALGDYRGALADYTQALRRGMSLAKTYLQRGDVRAALGDRQGAIADYTLALEAQPSSIAYSKRGLTYSDVGNHQQGLQDCNRAIDLEPSSVSAYQNRGLIRQRLGHTEGALDDLNIALRLEPQSAQTYYIRGIIRAKADDSTGAIADLTAAINIAPSHDLAHYERGIMRKQAGDMLGARRDLEQAADLCSKNGHYHCSEAAEAELVQLQPLRPSGSGQVSSGVKQSSDV